MTDSFTPKIEFEKKTFNPFNFTIFRKFLIDNKIFVTAISFAIGKQILKISTSFFNNLISPILNLDINNDGKGEIKSLKDYKLKIGRLEIKLGMFLSDILTFLIVLYALFLITRFTRDLTN